MGGQGIKQRFADAIAEKHVAEIGRVFGFQARAKAVLSDFLKRAGKPRRIACELHGRGISQKFALAADGGLNQPAKKNADGAEDHQDQSNQGNALFPRLLRPRA